MCLGEGGVRLEIANIWNELMMLFFQKLEHPTRSVQNEQESETASEERAW